MAVSFRSDSLMDDWCHVLELSKLRPGESVVVLSSDASLETNVAQGMRGAARMGARIFQMHVPRPVMHAGMDRSLNVGATPLAGNSLAIDTLKKADLIIDTFGLLHSPEQEEILSAGARMLMVVESPDVLSRNLPEQADKDRVMAADRWLRTGKVLRATSCAGTDLRLPIGQFRTIPEYGFADDPGHWDHWPSGFNSTFPNENEAEGMLVIAPGDMLFPFKSLVTDEIACQVKQGRIVSIEGGYDALVLERFLRSYEDPDAFAISHVGWGLQPKSKWTAQLTMDKGDSLGMEARAYAGNFLCSTGPNAEAGGSNKSRCHVDIPMFGCSVYVDDAPMVIDGRVVAEGQKV